MPPKKVSAPAEASRRSTRIAEQPAPVPKRSQSDEDSDDETTKKPAAKKPRKSKKTIEDEDGDNVPEEEEQAEEGGEAPPAGVKVLDLGDVLPDITLKNEKTEDVNVRDLAGEGSAQGVVFFLVPKANTPGCTTQACGFRDSYSGYKDQGYVVYCVSADSPNVQAKWQTKYTLPFPLLSDPKHTLIKALGAFKAPKSTKRSHFIFEKGTGKLIEKKLSVKPSDSPKDALSFIESHHAATHTTTTTDAAALSEPAAPVPVEAPAPVEASAPAEEVPAAAEDVDTVMETASEAAAPEVTAE